MSFYVGAIGADACLDKFSVVSNNLANVNNMGFKPRTAVFSELINYNLNDSREPVTELQAGASVKVQRTGIRFNAAAVNQTNSLLDFALMQDNTFFMVQDPVTDEISFTRAGRFHRGDQGDGFFLLSENNKLVLDRDGEPIELEGENDAPNKNEIGVYTFENPSRLMNIGNNEYVPSDDNVEAILVENPHLESSALESSGTDVAREFSRVIECQRAYSYALKMVMTSDEVEGTINTLRG